MRAANAQRRRAGLEPIRQPLSGNPADATGGQRSGKKKPKSGSGTQAGQPGARAQKGNQPKGSTRLKMSTTESLRARGLLPSPRRIVPPTPAAALDDADTGAEVDPEATSAPAVARPEIPGRIPTGPTGQPSPVANRFDDGDADDDFESDELAGDLDGDGVGRAADASAEDEDSEGDEDLPDESDDSDEGDSPEDDAPKVDPGAATRKPRKPRPEPAPRLIRLQRLMADCGIAARRVCERMIETGEVQVNGKITSRLPVFVDPHRDRILVQGRLLVIPKSARETAGSAPLKPVYLMLNKPARVMTTTSDDGGRTTVMDLIDPSSIPVGARIFPVGRLDFHASGMVILTNDGALAQRLSHAKYEVPRTYQLTLRGQPLPEELANLARTILPKHIEIDPAWFGTELVEQPIYAEAPEIDPSDDLENPDPRSGPVQARRPSYVSRNTGAPRKLDPRDPRDQYEDPRRAGYVPDRFAPKAEPQVLGFQKMLIPTTTRITDGPFRIIRWGRASRAVREKEPRASGPKTIVEVDLTRTPFASMDDLVTSTGLSLISWSVVAIGGLRMTGIQIGQWRPLTSTEVRHLKLAGGPTPAGAKGAKEGAHERRPKKPRMAPFPSSAFDRPVGTRPPSRRPAPDTDENSGPDDRRNRPAGFGQPRAGERPGGPARANREGGPRGANGRNGPGNATGNRSGNGPGDRQPPRGTPAGTPGRGPRTIRPNF